MKCKHTGKDIVSPLDTLNESEPEVGVQPDVRYQYANPWSINRTPGKPETILTFYEPDGKKACNVVMDRANAYMLGSHLINIQEHDNEAKKENIIVSRCQ